MLKMLYANMKMNRRRRGKSKKVMMEKLVKKDELIEILAEAVKLGKENLPDSYSFKDCWDEMTDEGQKQIKRVGVRLYNALKFYKEFKNAPKAD